MEKREVIYRHSGAVRITHWVNALVLLVLLMSGLQIFNAHPALYLGSKSTFDDPIMAMRAGAGRRQGQGRHHAVRPRLRHHRRVRACGRCRRRLRRPRLSLVVDAARPSRPRHGPALAFLLRLALPVQRARLSAVEPRQRPSPARSRADGRRAQAYRRLDRRACAAQIPQRRGGQALQRAAEAHLSLRRADPSAADAAHRARHVAGHGRGLPLPARHVRRPADGAHHPLHLGEPASCCSSSCISSWC